MQLWLVLLITCELNMHPKRGFRWLSSKNVDISSYTAWHSNSRIL